MKKIICTILVFVCMIGILKAQTIQIEQTFYSDAEIQPFLPDDTIYGLSVAGSLTLNSDTSLVRIILIDHYGNEWMVIEAYPLIVSETTFEFKDECDETCFLEETLPSVISIQIIDAEIDISYLSLITEEAENLSAQQYQAKRNLDQAKVQQMNSIIQARGWNWTAGDNELVEKFYADKTIIFSSQKYNMQGFDYYTNGVFKYASFHENLPDTSSLLPISFDWRSKHDATTPGSKYYFNENGWIPPLRQVQGVCGSCWAFAPVSTLEAGLNLFYNDTLNYDLSEQDVLCFSGGGNCSKGIIGPVFYYAAHTGIIEEQCLKYKQYDYHSDSCYDSICDDPTILVKIEGDSVVSNNNLDSFKIALMTSGPLAIGDTVIHHGLSLIGYYVNENNITNWIFKNSWFLNHPYDTLNASILDFDARRKINLPIYDENNILNRLCLDKDHDGYYNWGIGAKPTTCPASCSELEDWNDNRNRVGPRDSNFIGLEVQPGIIVQRGTVMGSQIQNGDLVMINGDIQSDTVFTFQISNLGTAQLNLVQINLTNNGLVTIPSQNPPNLFLIIDYPHKFVCMDNDTTAFKIQMNQGADTGAFARVQIHLNEPDMDSVFEFTLVYNGCETLSGYDSITTEVDWTDSFRSQNKDLHIQRNGSLTVFGTVMLSPDADIVVEPGGKLMIDGGKLTKLCPDQLWNGIQVWGDSTLSQQPDTNQGYLSVRNYGCIEYARTAVFAGKIDNGDTLYEYSGGIVYADDAVFRNNVTDVEFLPFINDHPYGGPELLNFSGFRHCTFLTHDPEFIIEKPGEHVILDGVNGVDFITCTFKTQEIPGHPFYDEEKGTGILVFDSQVYIQGACSSEITPCPGYDSCYFENLRYGIRAFNTGGNKYFSVSRTVFDNNISGIYLSGYHQPCVAQSYFYSILDTSAISGLEEAFYGGLYLDGSTGYQVENNHFDGPYNAVPDSGAIAKIGIYIKDSGEDENEIYNNLFTGLDAGIIAEGINKGARTGLCLKCNDFRTCLNDILVFEGTGQGRYKGINESQGMDDTLSYALAGNTFTPEVQGLQAIDNSGNVKYFWSYFNEADHFNYYHHGYDIQVVTYPFDTSNYSFKTITLNNKYTRYDKNTACPSGSIIPLYKDEEDPILEIAAADIQLTALKSEYDSLLDEGNTEALDFDIITSMPDEALELRDQLLSDSPYLSDTILKQAIYKEAVLPNAMIRDVLTANPQSAKSEDILDAVDDRYDPMPDYMMAEIMQGLNQIGALESLESKIDYWKQYRSMAVNRLIREYLTDTTIIYHNDSLIAIFQDDPSLQSKYRLAFTYWENNQFDEALEVINNILATFDLNSVDLSIYNQYLDYFDILKMMKDSSLNARQLDSSSIQTLFSIMNEELPLISNYARGLLIKGRHIDFTEQVAFPTEVKSYPAFYYLDSKKIIFPGEDHLAFFPNPAGDYVIVYFNSLDFGKPGLLSINDIHGRNLAGIKLAYEQNQVVIDLSGYTNGLYLVSLIVDNELVASKKLLKGRY